MNHDDERQQPGRDAMPDALRRGMLIAGAGLAAAAAARRAEALPATPPATPPAAAAAPAVPPPTAATIPLVLPRTEFVYEAVFELAPTMHLGEGPFGERHMVPITGGTFEGPNIRGKVLPGGADRQVWRRDGVHQLDAVYELQADDGAVISVRNRVIIDAPPGQPRYAFSTLELTAPEGPHAWLNRGVFVGTLNSLQPRAAVLIRAFRVV